MKDPTSNSFITNQNNGQERKEIHFEKLVGFVTIEDAIFIDPLLDAWDTW